MSKVTQKLREKPGLNSWLPASTPTEFPMNRIHPFICITEFLARERKLQKLKSGKIVILIGVGKRTQHIPMSLKRTE